MRNGKSKKQRTSNGRLEAKAKYPLELFLELAKLPKSNYYYTVKRLKASPKHEEERAAIRTICQKYKGKYGYRKVTLALRKQGHQSNHKLVMQLMKLGGLTCQLRQKRYQSYKGQKGKIAPICSIEISALHSLTGNG